MKKKILITGAYGFLGRELAVKLKKNSIVYGIGNSSKNMSFNHKNSFRKLIKKKVTTNTLLKNFNNIDFIVHCAGRVIGLKPELDYKKNVNTTIEILNFIKKLKKKPSVIFLSTIAVYKTINGKKIKENFVIDPTSHYAFNKKMSEDLLKFYSKKYKFNLLIARTTSLFGRGLQRQFIFDACKKLSTNNNNFFGTGNEVRDWLHVSDMCNLISRFVKKKFQGVNIINCGSGTGYKIKDVIYILKNLFNNKLPVNFNTISDSNPSIMVANISAAKKFGWTPKIEFEEGLNDYAKWYKKKFKI